MFINLFSVINQLGYGVVGFNILKSLHKAGHSTSLFPLFPLRDEDVRPYLSQLDLIKQCLENAKHYNVDAPSIRIWHQHELDRFAGRGQRIGWPIFELNRFKNNEPHQLSSVDRLFVCSKWAKQVIESNKINIDVDIIPLGYDPEVFYKDEEAKSNRPWYTKDETVFINIGKWEVRKGHNELCEAFSKAFTPKDNVRLMMMNDNPFIGVHGNEAWKRKFISSQMGARITLLPRVETQEEMRKIFNQVDFGVFPAHAEGWNLEILELMACGAPCIATNYSGHTEFLDNTNSLLVEPNGMQLAQDGIWFNGEGEWCSFSVDDLVDQMREAHRLKQEGKIAENFSGLNNTLNEYTWDNAVKKMVDIL